MPRARLVGPLMVFALPTITACIDAPTFILDETTTSDAPTTPIRGEDDDAMVLIAATTFPTQGTLSPSAPGGGSGDEKKGKGKGKDEGGGEPPAAEPDSGAPAPAEATTFVPPFWIDVHEVTARAYAACVAEGKCTAAGTGRGCTVGVGLDDHPASCVSIDQARAFCGARGKRLVTNDEWTAAAAGSELRPYPWGAAPPSPTLLDMKGDADGYDATAPVGSFPAGDSPDGVADLAGNVAEWVDLVGGNVTRGGSWDDDDATTLGSRAVRAADGPAPTIGFRCARDE